MKFFQFICTDAAAEPYDAASDDIQEWIQAMEAKGILLMVERLRPVEDATTVRIRDGKLLVTDGPFAETKEWVAGYGILECKDRAEAVKATAAHPMARFGQIELREFWDWSKKEGNQS